MKTLNWDDVLSGLSSAVSTIQSAPSKIAEGVSFAQDPVGWMCGKLADAINGLSTVVIPAILDATKPDLSAENADLLREQGSVSMLTSRSVIAVATK